MPGTVTRRQAISEPQMSVFSPSYWGDFAQCSFAAALPMVCGHYNAREILEQPFIHQKKKMYSCRPPKNPEAMALAMATLIDNPELDRTTVGCSGIG